LRCRLRILMAEQDPPLTQKELAKELSLGPNTVNKLYNNSFKRIDTETIEKLCHFFSCDINEFFELKVPVSRNLGEIPKRERQ
jgi:putative transcriptional regulator